MVFSLMKRILEKIFFDFIKPKFSVIHLEPFIIFHLNKINQNISTIYFEPKYTQEGKNMIIYNPLKDSILPFCDLNIKYFFEIFNINDVLLLSEYYFLTKSIIFVSPNCELLYPIYHILMTFFYPLNFHLKYYFYKILYPLIVISGLFSPISCFHFIYTENKISENNSYLSQKVLDKIIKDKKEVLIYQIWKQFDKEANREKVKVVKNIYLYDEEKNKIIIESIDSHKGKTLVEKVFVNDNIYLQTINSEIQSIKKSSKGVETDFFDFPEDLGTYDLMRKNFLGLILKFLVSKIEPLTFKIEDDKMTICNLTINEKEDLKSKEMEKLKDFLEGSPQTEIIYKNEIINCNILELDYLKTQILLDYFIKISKNDPNRIYFDEININKTKEEDNKNNTINFNDIFNYKQCLDSNYGKDLKIKKEEIKEEVLEYKILPIANAKKLIDIDEKKLIDKFGPEIDNVILYNENFNLDFSKYNYNNILELNQKKMSSNQISISEKNSKNKKYFYLVLYEAKIFKKLFYTINSDNRKELATCAIGLYLSLYILYLLKKKKNNEDENPNLANYIQKLFEKLFLLFTRTNCFYGKYNFITTLVYLILSSYPSLKQEYKERFIFSLKELKNVPSIILFLLYNNNIEFDFFEEYSNFKKIKIAHLDQVKHKHKFETDSLAGYFICDDKNCQEYMWFNIVNTLNNNMNTENALNPSYLIEKCLNKIEEQNNVILSDFGDVDDINQIEIWDEIYFKIRFFRDDYIDELEY